MSSLTGMNETPRRVDLLEATYGYQCRAYEINMSEVYGELGSNVIHVHHRSLLADFGQEHEVDPIRDLIPVLQ